MTAGYGTEKTAGQDCVSCQYEEKEGNSAKSLLFAPRLFFCNT